jgi:hypothetical protein
MKKHIKDLMILLAVLFLGYNLILNVYIRDALKKVRSDISYTYCISVIPDRIIFFGVMIGTDISVRALTIDASIQKIIKKDFTKSIDGITLDGLKLVYGDGSGSAAAAGQPAFLMPFFTYVKLIDAEVVYIKPETMTELKITGINGTSRFVSTGRSSQDYLDLKASGNFQGSLFQRINMHFTLFPYFKNKFYLTFVGNGIDLKEFEQVLAVNNIKVDRGALDFICQMRCEMRSVHFNNIMRFRNVKIRENTALDVKALFGVSVEQLVDFLGDSKGNFAADFSYAYPDSEMDRSFEYYSDHLKDSLGNRIKMGVATAPLRQVKDLIWNLTGENVARIVRLFGGN